MIRGLATLRYLEYRRFVHRMRDIRKSPARTALWFVWIVALGILLFVRSRLSHHVARTGPLADVHIAAIAGGVYIAVVGFFLMNVRRSAVPAFDSLAEARFTALSAIPPVLVVAALQIRTSIGLVFRMLVSLSVALVTLAPRGGGDAAFARYIVALTLATLLLAALPFPIALVRGRARALYRVLGGVVVAIGAYVAVREIVVYLVPSAARVAAAAPDLTLGPFVVSLFAGAWLPLATLAVACLATLALAVAVARDTYPELYEMTVAGVDRSDLRRGGAVNAIARANERRAKRFAKGRANVVTRDERRIPSGAWVLVWRSWVVFRRARGTTRALLALAFWYALAATFGVLYRTGGDIAQEILTTVGITGVFVAVVIGSIFGQTVALDIRKPLFWLAGPTTYARLTALIASALWRGTITFGGAAVVFLAVSGNAALAYAAPFLAAATVMLLQTTGFALYALFPARIDQAGPLAAIRMFLALGSLAVPIAMTAALAIGAAYLAARIPPIGVACIFAVVATVEAGLLLLFAAWRIDARLDAFTRAEV